MANTSNTGLCATFRPLTGMVLYKSFNFPLASAYRFGRVTPVTETTAPRNLNLATHSPCQARQAVLSGTEFLEVPPVNRHVFPTNQQLVIVLAILPLMLLLHPVETIRAWRG